MQNNAIIPTPSSQLMEELKMIEEKLKNLDLENIEERSDIASRVGDVRYKLLSQKSFLSNLTPIRHRRRQSYLERISETPQPQIIEEEAENEQHQETVQLQKKIELEEKKEFHQNIKEIKDIGHQSAQGNSITNRNRETQNFNFF